MLVELPVNLEAHYELLGGGGAASEAAGEEVADLAEAELGGAVARGGVLPWAAHGAVLRRSAAIALRGERERASKRRGQHLWT